MANILGSVTLGGELGGWTLINQSANRLPQDVASGFSNAQEGLVGASYNAIFYVARQLVNGFNHLIIAEETRTTKNADKRIVAIVLHIPMGDIGGKNAKFINIVSADEATIPEDVLTLFNASTKKLIGAVHKPVVYIGSQLVKGINYYVVCETNTSTLKARPYATVATLNVFNGKTTIKFDRL